MTDLNDLVEAYKREAAVPGAFEATFPGMSTNDIIGALGDAFAEAQLDGFFGTMVLDMDEQTITPDLSAAGAALVVIYAGMRLTRLQLRGSASQGVRYKAGPVEYQTTASASVLAQALKDLETRRKELLGATRSMGTMVFMLEGYVPRGTQHNAYGGMFAYEQSFPVLGLGY